MKKILSHAALTIAVLSAMGTVSVGAVGAETTVPEIKNTIVVVKEPAADSRSKSGWLAEQLAVTAFGDSLQYWQAASENDGVMPQDSKNNLSDIGHSYTSNNLPALGVEDDYSLALKSDEDTASIGPVYRVGDVYKPSATTKKTVKGVFTTYHEKDMDITVYTGPDKSRLEGNQLRGQGATYLFPVGTITNLHTTEKGLVTVRDIGVGSSRMEMIFSYGSPNAMWRNQSDESYIFLYEGHAENSWTEKKEFTSLVANTNNNSQSPDSIQNGKSYVAFTVKNNVIEAVDILDGQVWTRFGLPKAPMYHFHAGQLSDDDFVLRGLRLNQHFVNDADAEWRTQGMLFGATFIGYNEYGVSVDDKSLINRVLLNVYTPTRRGIAMGDTKYLLLFVYGMPTRIVESATNTGTATVYEYKNPRSSNSYLQFALDDKNQYIKSLLIRELSEQKGWKYLEAKQLIEEEFLLVPRDERPKLAEDVIRRALSRSDTEVLLLDGINVLFAPILNLNPLELLKTISKTYPIVVGWRGHLEGDQLYLEHNNDSKHAVVTITKPERVMVID